MNIEQINPSFGARVTGIGHVSELDEAAFARLRQCFEDYSVLVLPDQPMDDDQQIAFSERFGPLERTISTNPAGGTAFARQSNIDIKTGETISPDDRRMMYQKANMLWHADSTFKATQSLCSILSAREVPAEGGATDFASTRSVYEGLSEAEQKELDDLKVEHDIIYSRQIIGFEFTDKERAEMPAVQHPLVQINPLTGRKSLLIGAHARSIVGWPFDKARALLDRLGDAAIQSENTFSHHWKTGDVVIWDNRSAIHRATPYDTVKYRRLMQRTTISIGSVD
ncbi:MAG: TauD/TfdA family dioxygenase [Pseudomonadota bacterium]